MDLNRLTRDADDLIRKVVSRYNQLYGQSGNISQVELDLMLDDMRRLYDTFKTIGHINLTLQHNTVKQEVSVNAMVVDDSIDSSAVMPPESGNLSQLTQSTLTRPEQKPTPVLDPEPASNPEPEVQTNNENEITPSSYLEVEPEPNTGPEPGTEAQPEKRVTDQAEISPAESGDESEIENKSVATNTEPSPPMLADRFAPGNKSLSETIASSKTQGVVGSRLMFHPISDLSAGIGLNDKFSFISELFGNNAVQYEEAITRINKAVNADEASWILQKYHKPEWDQKTETLDRLKDFVKRRFI